MMRQKKNIGLSNLRNHLTSCFGKNNEMELQQLSHSNPTSLSANIFIPRSGCVQVDWMGCHAAHIMIWCIWPFNQRRNEAQCCHIKVCQKVWKYNGLKQRFETNPILLLTMWGKIMVLIGATFVATCPYNS